MSGVSATPLTIVGVGDDGLEGLAAAGRAALAGAELLAGPPRILALAPASAAERLPFGTDLQETVRRLADESTRRRTVVLVAGDPLFYGVANLLVERLGKERVDILPHVSTMQLAFARVKEDWDEAYLGDLSRHAMAQVLDRIRDADRAGLFASDEWPPARFARALVEAGLTAFRMYVCENLGARNEVVTQGTPAELAEMAFGNLAVIVLVREAGAPDPQRAGVRRRLFGNPDDFFRQSRPKRGLLTPAEIRVLALADLDLQPDHVVWDVGAGSGAVSVEAASIAAQGRVFAIEPHAEDAELIAANAKTFGVNNVTVVADRAPHAFEELPDPDAVFLGGLGRETVGVLSAAFARLKSGGVLSANLASMENAGEALRLLRELGAEPTVRLLQIARGVHQLDALRFQAVNPSFLISARKR